jgi:ABC-type sugar transport system ATPase subunit
MTRGFDIDEPTSALRRDQSSLSNHQGIEERGIGINHSHKFDEVFKFSRPITVSVMVDTMITRDAAGLRSSDLISLMVGRDLSVYPRLDSAPGEPRSSLPFSKRDRFQDVSFEVRHGEVLGIADSWVPE